MNQEIEQLLVIQDRDRKIAHLKLEQQSVPREEASLEEQLKKHSARLEEVKVLARQVETARKKIELDVQSKRDSIAKFKVQQFQTKKNDEYQALGHEIDRYGRDITEMEDQELVLMEDYEKAQKTVAEEEKKLKDFKTRLDVQKQDLKKKLEAVVTQLDSLEKERQQLAGQIEATLFSRYERILKSKKDSAIVPVEHGDTCGGCHMKLTPNTIHATKAGGSIPQCDYCGRMIYNEEWVG